MQFGRGFSVDNLERMRNFFFQYPPEQISATLSRILAGTNSATQSTHLNTETLASAFPLSWSHYVRLMAITLSEARRFYEAEALRGGWSLRQLERQINTSFYERTALSKNKAALLEKVNALPSDAMTTAELIKDPYVLEFLGLKDEYSESDLEDALIQHLETFLLEMGADFTFIARQKRIRVGDDWFRIDLLLFHRRLRCLVIIDIKIGKFDHADAGQMNLYVNYAAENLTLPGENPPVGIILCSEPNAAVARYALGGLQNEIHAAQYRLLLPDPKKLEVELEETRKRLQNRKP